MLDPTIKAQWLAALRSGHYQQGKEYLYTDDGSYCCLGVLCHIQRPSSLTDGTFDDLRVSTLPPSLAAGLSTQECYTLAHMNDRGKSFHKIAAYIEETL